jgi:hypothetical protein
VPFPKVCLAGPIFLPSLAPRPTCLTRLSDDPTDQHNRFRVERDDGWDMIEVVDEQVSSRAATAQITHINDKLLLTPEDARWLRDALTEILGEDE